MRYSFDKKKRATNLDKHGLDLADAKLVIESGLTVTFEDRRFDYGEQRYVTIGPLKDELVVVVTTENDDEVRIISMRKASKDEKTIYRDYL